MRTRLSAVSTLVSVARLSAVSTLVSVTRSLSFLTWALGTEPLLASARASLPVLPLTQHLSCRDGMGREVTDRRKVTAERKVQGWRPEAPVTRGAQP